MAQAAAAAVAPQLSDSVVSVPTKFNGDRTTYKSWIQSINMYFAANPTFFAMEKSKILATLSCLEGGAATTFADLYYDQHLQQGVLVPGTWQDFVNELNTKHEMEPQCSGPRLLLFRFLSAGSSCRETHLSSRQ